MEVSKSRDSHTAQSDSNLLLERLLLHSANSCIACTLFVRPLFCGRGARSSAECKSCQRYSSAAIMWNGILRRDECAVSSCGNYVRITGVQATSTAPRKK